MREVVTHGAPAAHLTAMRVGDLPTNAPPASTSAWSLPYDVILVVHAVCACPLFALLLYGAAEAERLSDMLPYIMGYQMVVYVLLCAWALLPRKIPPSDWAWSMATLIVRRTLITAVWIHGISVLGYARRWHNGAQELVMLAFIPGFVQSGLILACCLLRLPSA